MYLISFFSKSCNKLNNKKLKLLILLLFLFVLLIGRILYVKENYINIIPFHNKDYKLEWTKYYKKSKNPNNNNDDINLWTPYFAYRYNSFMNKNKEYWYRDDHFKFLMK